MNALYDFSILLLIAHFLGDYQLQWEALAEEKAKKASGMIKHLGIHLLLLAALLAWGLHQGLGLKLLLPIFIVFGVHVLIDLIKKLIGSKTKKMTSHKTKVAIYIIDQLLHLIAIALISQVFFVDPIKSFKLGTYITREMVNWVLLIVLVTKPANVSFKVLFEKYQYKEEVGDNTINSPEEKSDMPLTLDEDCIQRLAVGIASTSKPNAENSAKEDALQKQATVPGAGAIIGNMERLLSAVFLAAGQWAAIGMVFTAKSIARFKQIEKNRQFAEYYLIGTLYSILFVVLAYFIIFKI